MAKIKVSYVVAENLQEETLEAASFYCHIKAPKIGNIRLRDRNGAIIGIKMYGQCEKIDFLEL